MNGVCVDMESKVLNPIKEFKKIKLSYLERFICDARKENSDRYPPQTFKELFAGIQFHFDHYYKGNFRYV